ncbi:predicted protein [Aspergillus nidulans FGSC A4]|uniref:Uncharacterized protein n=1 Tax=Emericella nidulans (strain FGSC A4 / ATCC 38163 / CBS 112.46 / NRRL 194 / M139) TaxID=227321 RepID=Q5AWB0_EMENI|nr:hypothetical protein [Aspergillus nidulans FGSC A4]EAA61791.1 predicted protein [Aspergillus nidulans FGSC A4]CBF78411.1 TPA: conserved hypothetical protein [Aspergillus nidulans FGSC A4]|eukprot:XP_680689.1 predicted protein [Aspergillus nidulans FGSC A4]
MLLWGLSRASSLLARWVNHNSYLEKITAGPAILDPPWGKAGRQQVSLHGLIKDCWRLGGHSSGGAGVAPQLALPAMAVGKSGCGAEIWSKDAKLRTYKLCYYAAMSLIREEK